MAREPNSEKSQRWLILLLIWTASILFYGFRHAKMATSVYVLWIVPVFLLIGMVSQLHISLKPFDKLLLSVKQIPFLWYLVPSMTATSFIAAKLSLIPRDNYWPLFAIWIVSVSSLFFWAVIAYLPFSAWSWHNLKKTIWKYRWEVAAVAGIAIFSFSIRIISLTTLPGPLGGDDGENSLNAMLVNEGATKNMFGIAGSYEHPTMYFFILAPFHRLFPPEIAIRLPSVIIGTLSIIVFYIFIRMIWKSRLLAFVSTLYLSTYHYHQQYSRMGLPNIADLIFVLLALLFAWRALNVGHKSDFVLMGLTTGLSMYFYTGARLSLFVTLAYLAFFAFWRKSFWKRNAMNVALAALVCSTALLPIWLHWEATGSSFIKRYQVSGVLNPNFIHEKDTHGYEYYVKFFYDNTIEVFGFFGFKPEKNWGFYKPPIPLIDKFTLPFFILGFFLCLIKFWDQRSFILLIMFFGSVVAGGILTGAPHSGRLLSTIPAIAAFTGIGILRIADIFKNRGVRNATIVLIILILVSYNLWFYLYVYGHGRLYADWNTWMQYDLGKYVETLPSTTHIIYYNPGGLPTNNPPLKIRFRKYHHYDVYEDGHMNVKPPVESTPRVFIFPRGEREQNLKDLQIACPGGDLRVFHDEKGKLQFKTYEFLNGSACLPPEIAKQMS